MDKVKFASCAPTHFRFQWGVTSSHGVLFFAFQGGKQAKKPLGESLDSTPRPAVSTRFESMESIGTHDGGGGGGGGASLADPEVVGEEDPAPAEAQALYEAVAL
jgi:hypothetical protein